MTKGFGPYRAGRQIRPAGHIPLSRNSRLMFRRMSYGKVTDDRR